MRAFFPSVWVTSCPSTSPYLVITVCTLEPGFVIIKKSCLYPWLVSLNTTDEWDHPVLLFLPLAYFTSIISSNSIQVAANCMILYFFLWLNDISFCIFLHTTINYTFPSCCFSFKRPFLLSYWDLQYYYTLHAYTTSYITIFCFLLFWGHLWLSLVLSPGSVLENCPWGGWGNQMEFRHQSRVTHCTISPAPSHNSLFINLLLNIWVVSKSGLFLQSWLFY